ncbi:MAG: class I SAM-dependent methyltransferase [Candidatus Nanopelagicales bacterium]
MTDHSERAEWFTGPWVESVTRYRWFLERAALPPVLMDLGCGNASGLIGALASLHRCHDWWPEVVVLVDTDADSLAEACESMGDVTRRLGRAAPTTRACVADLSGSSVEVAALVADYRPAVTAFEVLEHLADSTAALSVLRSAGEHAPAALSVPHDAFFHPANPYHLITPSEATVAEYRGFLGQSWTAEQQYRVSGTAIGRVGPGTGAATFEIDPGAVPVASHFLLSTGLAPAAETAVVGLADSDDAARHVWAVQREIDLYHYQGGGRA